MIFLRRFIVGIPFQGLHLVNQLFERGEVLPRAARWRAPDGEPVVEPLARGRIGDLLDFLRDLRRFLL
jgi:hypothetical protein